MLQDIAYSFRTATVATGTSNGAILGYITVPATMHCFLKRLEAYSGSIASDDAYAIGWQKATGTAAGGVNEVLAPVGDTQYPPFASGTANLGGVFKWNEASAITGLTGAGNVFAIAQGNKMDVPVWQASDEAEYVKMTVATTWICVLNRAPTATLNLNISGVFGLI